MAQDAFPGRGRVFADEGTPRVDILIAEDDLRQVLGDVFSYDEYPATFIFSDGETPDTIRQVGFRIRGNTSRTSAKKSFKVSFNTFEAGRDWRGFEKLNLNGEHNDPTASRAVICWDMLRDMRVPAPRANHVRLYINGEFKGVYANVEHIDEEFVEDRFGNKNGNLYKCLYPVDLKYLGEAQANYEAVGGNRRAYDLRTNTEANDYSDLIEFIRVLNLTPIQELPCELENVFNVDTYLRALAADVLFGNWDGYAYNQNNFYLYHNTATDQFEYIPYDLDNTLGIDWLNQDWGNRDVYNWPQQNSDRPLFDRMMRILDYRNRYTYYLRTFVEEVFNEEELFPYFDEIREKLTPYIAEDAYYPRDYGFSPQDFQDAFETSTDYFQTDYSLKAYVEARVTSALEQLENRNLRPIIAEQSASAARVGQVISFKAAVIDDNSLREVDLCYRVNGGSQTCVTMHDDGASSDDLANDGVYGASISAQTSNVSISWRIIATDNEGESSNRPRCGDYNLVVSNEGPQLAINEFMASNDITIADEEGEYDDWVEIHNYGSTSVDLNGLYLSDNEQNPTKWAFPDRSIGAGEYLLIWTDNDPEQGDLHADFKLAAEGEYIGIFDSDSNDNALVDGYEYGEQMTDAATGRLPNGTGPMQRVEPTPGRSNMPVNVLDPLRDEIQIRIYPNPFTETLVLECAEIGDFEVLLLDAFGRELVSQLWNGQQLEWSPKLPSGIYFLQVYQSERLIDEQMIVKN